MKLDCLYSGCAAYALHRVVRSTGLDSTTAFEIILALQVWASGTGGTVVATLLQVWLT